MLSSRSFQKKGHGVLSFVIHRFDASALPLTSRCVFVIVTVID